MAITVVKLDPQSKETFRYPAEILARLHQGVVLDAYWDAPERDLGYTTFATGDHFLEYFYTERWFNIFAISTPQGERKGWYCNIAAPAQISAERVEQIDLLLDVWVYPDGRVLILDEDEFDADRTLTQEQRAGAHDGLQALLAMIAARHDPFGEIAPDASFSFESYVK